MSKPVGLVHVLSHMVQFLLRRFERDEVLENAYVDVIHFYQQVHMDEIRNFQGLQTKSTYVRTNSHT